MQGVKPFTIGFVTDPSLSREKTQIALRALNSLRGMAEIRYYPGNLTEEQLLERVKRESLDLLLVPWHSYLHFQKIEAHFGLTRTHGPTMAGYFAEDLSPYELQEEDHHFRAILVDLNHLATGESAGILRSLLRDSTRWGLRPHLVPSTPLHFETWSAHVGLGFRMDTVLALNEIAAGAWSKRANSIRIIISAMWSLIFDQGPGKADREKTAINRPPRGSFEVGADAHCLGLRLCYVEPAWKVKDVLHQFWPGALTPSNAGQVLNQYADFLRVHVDPETNELELVALLYPSAPSERSSDTLKTLWIEPLSHLTRLERAAEAPETQEPHHKPLVTHHHLIGNAAEKIEELKKAVEAKDTEIQGLRSKGVTTEHVFIYPNGMDGEQLLELMNRRIAESKMKIKSLQAQIQGLRRDNSDDVKEASRLMQDIRELAAEQKGWIARISEMVGHHHEAEAAAEVQKSESASAPSLGEAQSPEQEEEAALAVAGTQVREPKSRRLSKKPLKKAV